MPDALPLFDVNRAAHALDPATSYHAAEQAGELAAKHHRKILEFLDGLSPYAAHYRAIAEGTGLDPVAVARRMVELERANLIERAGTARMDNGRRGTLWKCK